MTPELEQVRIPAADIQDRQISNESLMPSGLVDSLTPSSSPTWSPTWRV